MRIRLVTAIVLTGAAGVFALARPSALLAEKVGPGFASIGPLAFGPGNVSSRPAARCGAPLAVDVVALR